MYITHPLPPYCRETSSNGIASAAVVQGDARTVGARDGAASMGNPTVSLNRNIAMASEGVDAR